MVGLDDFFVCVACMLVVRRDLTLSLYLSKTLFFFNDTATTEIYTLSLHDALPIAETGTYRPRAPYKPITVGAIAGLDRKSTRLNSSHQIISYAVFCLKKKKSAFSSSVQHMPSVIRGLTSSMSTSQTSPQNTAKTRL